MSYQPRPVTTTGTSRWAATSLVFGIAGLLLLPLIGAIIAIICGHLARREIRRTPVGSVEGNGLAITGLVLGYAQCLLSVALVFVMYFALDLSESR